MNGQWRRSGINNPYVNNEVAWQRIQDLQREAENRRMLKGSGPTPIELVALAWLKRSVIRLAKSARSLSRGWLQRPSRDGDLTNSRKEVA